MNFKKNPQFRLPAALFVCCMMLHAAVAEGQETLRDAAAGTQASLASPAGEKVLDTLDKNDTEDVFLDEFMNYQMKLLKNWKLRVFTSGTWRYDSNVFLRNSNVQSDTMWSVSPGFQYSYGDDQAKLQVLADYNAQFNFYDKFSQQNSLNHFLRTSLNYRMQKTSFKFSGLFHQVTGGDLDVGGQASRVQFSPQLQIMYELSEKVRVGLSGQLQRTHYDALISSTIYRFGLFADYSFSPRFRLGLQFNEMIQEVDRSGGQSGQDYLVRLEYEASKKLSLNGSAGIHILHTASAGDATLPLGTLGFKYAPGPKTTLYANMYARAQNSPSLGGQYYQSQGVLIGAQQQLGSKLTVGADFGYDFSAYHSYLAGVSGTRRDHVRFMRPWVKYALQRHLSLEIFYQHTTNDSTGTGAQPFARDLVGAGITGSW
ncbi:hypothetical protein [Prosthecobacter sp.]|uniref:hypothetical protein n=1 Tax=Prosthecobacter sp. TaxID=1965333 RepID=UPI00378370C0